MSLDCVAILEKSKLPRLPEIDSNDKQQISFPFFFFFFHTMKRIIRTISYKSILLFKITSIKNYVFISVHNKNFKIMNMWFGENTEIQKEVLSK